MSQPKHTPEPWEITEVGEYCGDIISSKGDVRAICQLSTGHKNHKVNGKRIVACVNFCRGYDTEILRNGHTLDEFIAGHTNASYLGDINPKAVPAMLDALKRLTDVAANRSEDSLAAAIDQADDAIAQALEKTK
jgi:hypothetical protein